MTIQKYSKPQEAEMYDCYKEAGTDDEREDVVEKFVLKYKKPSRSIIAKLSKMGIYQPKIKLSKITGRKAETKEAMVKRLELMYDWPECVGLDKAPKLTLQKMLREKQ